MDSNKLLSSLPNKPEKDFHSKHEKKNYSNRSNNCRSIATHSRISEISSSEGSSCGVSDLYAAIMKEVRVILSHPRFYIREETYIKLQNQIKYNIN